MGCASRRTAGGTQVRGGGPGPWLVATRCPPRRLDSELPGSPAANKYPCLLRPSLDTFIERLLCAAPSSSIWAEVEDG